MIWLLVLLLLGLVGGYWFLHNEATTTFWELAGLGVFVMLMLVGVGFLAQAARGRRR